MNNVLYKSVTLPYSQVNGSLAQRRLKADKLVEEFYTKIVKDLKTDTDLKSYTDIAKIIESILPANIKLIIRENKCKFCDAYVDVTNNKEKKFSKYLLALVGISSTVRSVHIPNIVHEFQHFADYLLHPKFLAREQALIKPGRKMDKFKKLYRKHIYSETDLTDPIEREIYLEKIKSKTKKFLDSCDTSIKIDYLQDLRYSLKSEINAYKIQQKTAKDLYKKHLSVYKCDVEDDRCQSYMFQEKIEMLEELLKQEIQEQRQNHKQNLKLT